MHMFMGLLAVYIEACSHVLFVSQRHGDVTVWYQSHRFETMGLYGPRRCNERSRISFFLTAIRNLRTTKISRIFLSVDSRVIRRLEVSTSDVAEGLTVSHPPLRLREGFGHEFCGRRKGKWFARPPLRKPKLFGFQ